MIIPATEPALHCRRALKIRIRVAGPVPVKSSPSESGCLTDPERVSDSAGLTQPCGAAAMVHLFQTGLLCSRVADDRLLVDFRHHSIIRSMPPVLALTPYR